MEDEYDPEHKWARQEDEDLKRREQYESEITTQGILRAIRIRACCACLFWEDSIFKKPCKGCAWWDHKPNFINAYRNDEEEIIIEPEG